MLREAEELSDYFNWHPADLKRKAGSYKKEKKCYSYSVDNLVLFLFYFVVARYPYSVV